MAKISRVPKKAWDRYKDIINNFIDLDSGKQPFIWLKNIDQPLAFGEDSGVKYIPTKLEGLFQYNFIKTWSSSGRNSLSGELDSGNMVLYISANLLRENNLLNEYGYWDFNWSEDRFILNGKVYKPSGDTQVAQASDEALLFFIILDREDMQETKNILQSYISDTTIISSRKQPIVLNTNGKKVIDIIKIQ